MLARILGGVGKTLITAGLLVLGFVAFQLWGTGLETARGQDELTSTLAANLGDEDGVDLDPSTVSLEDLAEALDRINSQTAPAAPAPPEGEPVGIIEIPRIEVQDVIVEGVTKADLKKGPGHYPGTPLPGQAGNSGIAGHRTTYGAPFNRIDELVAGDVINIATSQGAFVYRVIAAPGQSEQAWYAVSPKDVSVLNDVGDNRITLTACHPKYSAKQRIIVHAVLEAEPAASPTTTVPAATDAGSTQDAEMVAIELDEGGSGDPSALPRALIFLGAAIALGALAWFVGRHWKPWIVYAAASPGVLVLIWFCYVHMDRYLPAL